jgi:hypothetical protein
MLTSMPGFESGRAQRYLLSILLATVGVAREVLVVFPEEIASVFHHSAVRPKLNV